MSLINYVIGQKRNKSARRALEAANAEATVDVNRGYDTALSALDTGQHALESGYQSAKDTKTGISAEMGNVAQQGYDAQSAMWTPWTVPGLNAYKNMDTLLNDPEGYNTVLKKFQESPQFKFQLAQATDAVKRSAAATGNRLGGAQLSALSGRANDVANQSFNGWLDRLQQLAQTGFSAQANLSQAQNNLTTGKTNALQYGDTSALDVAQGKDVLGINQQRGDIGVNRSQDMANLALGRGTIGANYHLAAGKNAQDFVNSVGKAATALM